VALPPPEERDIPFINRQDPLIVTAEFVRYDVAIHMAIWTGHYQRLDL